MKNNSEKKTKAKRFKNTSEIPPFSAAFNQPAYPEGISGPPSRGHNYRRILLLTLQAIINAIIIGFIAKGMIALIDFVTNVCFYGEFSFKATAPGIETLGAFVILIPILGGVVVGFMARYGSPGIRGHGIPEAMENILLNKSRIKPIITLLKPLSAAITIGTGAPFGAEGPIISGGGALGSFAGQIMKINDTERKIMLAAGACAGMAATFGSPLSGLLLGIELLLFEFSPRSIIPVAFASATGAVMHFLLFSSQPIFAMPNIPSPDSLAIILYTFLGAIIGIAACYASKAVYLFEDLYAKLPVHWMWWPAIGAVAVGVIGYFAPETMGVGYNNIKSLLSGTVGISLLFSFFILKFLSWSIALASGTSGGTLAPLFTIGGGLGALLGLLMLHFFPDCGINVPTAALIGMAAMFAGASRALLTSIVFALETTGQIHGLLPLIGACTAAYFISFFLMKGSIMTERMERKGLSPPEIFKPDRLEQILARNAMEKNVSILSSDNTIKEVREWIKENAAVEKFTSFVVAGEKERFEGVVQRVDIFGKEYEDETPITTLIKNKDAYVFPNNQLSLVVEVMDKYKVNSVPVVSHDEGRRVLGVIYGETIFAIYNKRRDDEELEKQMISLRRRTMRIISKGKHLFNKEDVD